MRETNRMNTLLVELLIVILFFMLSATTIIELFGTARLRSVHAMAQNEATLQAENLAERLYDEEDPAAWLEENGFTREGDRWIHEEENYRLEATISQEEQEAGTLKTVTLTATRGEETLLEIPAARYWPRRLDFTRNETEAETAVPAETGLEGVSP